MVEGRFTQAFSPGCNLTGLQPWGPEPKFKPFAAVF
jgi:hypothetical protein